MMARSEAGDLSAFPSLETNGITRREYFAAAALAGLVGIEWELNDGTKTRSNEEVAQAAFEIADAMIAADEIE